MWAGRAASFTSDYLGKVKLQGIRTRRILKMQAFSYDKSVISGTIKERVRELGFAEVGIAPAISPAGLSRFHEWLEAGYAGEMKYMHDRRDAYSHPRFVLDGVKSIVVMTMDYKTAEPQLPREGYGQISRYAWGDVDYHDLIFAKLKELAKSVSQSVPEAKVRGVVDTAPLLEREFASLAGIGWQGKNSLLLSKKGGSWFFLAALLTDLELEYDSPMETEHCGTCTNCLDACPTNAFVAPYVLDATRCISYLTIELRNSIPMELRKPIGNWIWGCDVCQEVCPWQSKSRESVEADFQPIYANGQLELTELFSLDDAGFRQRFRKTPLWRAKRRGLLRNAAIALGNQRSSNAVPALLRGLVDEEGIVRGAAAWALGEIGAASTLSDLKLRLQCEVDIEVKAEIQTAIDKIG